MSKYDDSLFDSDLDAFKNSGAVLDAAISFGGVLGGGAEVYRESQPLVVPNPDLAQVMFANSIMHPNKYKALLLENATTLINESTFGSQLTVWLGMRVSGGQIVMFGRIMNAYSSAVALDGTVINFRYIPYEATF